MNDVGTTTGELVCEVRVNGFDVARLPRVLAAADRYAAACAAVTVAQAAEEAAWAPWRAYIATRSAHDSEAMRLKRPAIAAGSATRAAEHARNAAGAAVLAAARGDL